MPLVTPGRRNKRFAAELGVPKRAVKSTGADHARKMQAKSLPELGASATRWVNQSRSRATRSIASRLGGPRLASSHGKLKRQPNKSLVAVVDETIDRDTTKICSLAGSARQTFA